MYSGNHSDGSTPPHRGAEGRLVVPLQSHQISQSMTTCDGQLPFTLHAMLQSAENLEPPIICFCKENSNPIRRPGQMLLKEMSLDHLHQN